MIRTIHKTKAFEDFYSSLNERTQKKADYTKQIVIAENIIIKEEIKNGNYSGHLNNNLAASSAIAGLVSELAEL